MGTYSLLGRNAFTTSSVSGMNVLVLNTNLIVMTTTLKNCRNPLLISALSMLLFAEATAQSTHHPFTVSLTGGPSFPLDRFADKNSNDWNTSEVDKAGAAQTGWSGSLQLSYQLDTHFGIALTAGINQYKRDGEALRKYYDLFSSYSGGVSVMDAKKWNVLKVLAGPTYTTAISKKLLFQSGVSAGIGKTAIPGFNYAKYDSGGNPMMLSTNSKVKMPAAFAYQVNAGLGYKLSQTFLLLFDMSYFDATATHKYTYFLSGPTFPDPGIDLANEVKDKYKLSAFSATLGIGLRF